MCDKRWKTSFLQLNSRAMIVLRTIQSPNCYILSSVDVYNTLCITHIITYYRVASLEKNNNHKMQIRFLKSDMRSPVALRSVFFMLKGSCAPTAALCRRVSAFPAAQQKGRRFLTRHPEREVLGSFPFL